MSSGTKDNKVVLAQNKQSNECIKVCIRVRPLLQHELMNEEIVYYPESNDPSLMVSAIFFFLSFKQVNTYIGNTYRRWTTYDRITIR